MPVGCYMPKIHPSPCIITQPRANKQRAV